MFTLVKIAWIVLTIAIMIKIWRNDQTEITTKLLWTLLIVMLPVIGIIIWLFYGQNSKTTA